MRAEPWLVGDLTIDRTRWCGDSPAALSSAKRRPGRWERLACASPHYAPMCHDDFAEMFTTSGWAS